MNVIDSKSKSLHIWVWRTSTVCSCTLTQTHTGLIPAEVDAEGRLASHVRAWWRQRSSLWDPAASSPPPVRRDSSYQGGSEGPVISPHRFSAPTTAPCSLPVWWILFSALLSWVIWGIIPKVSHTNCSLHFYYRIVAGVIPRSRTRIERGPQVIGGRKTSRYFHRFLTCIKFSLLKKIWIIIILKEPYKLKKVQKYLCDYRGCTSMFVVDPSQRSQDSRCV